MSFKSQIKEKKHIMAHNFLWQYQISPSRLFMCKMFLTCWNKISDEIKNELNTSELLEYILGEIVPIVEHDIMVNYHNKLGEYIRPEYMTIYNGTKK